MTLYKARRIVTGHDERGRSTVIADGTAENILPNPADPDRGHINFWRTERVPADIESRQFFNELQSKAAPKREDVATWFDLLDVDDYASFGGKA